MVVGLIGFQHLRELLHDGCRLEELVLHGCPPPADENISPLAREREERGGSARLGVGEARSCTLISTELGFGRWNSETGFSPFTSCEKLILQINS
jgi:hypothetical protein